MLNNPKISILIPIYNGGEYLKKLINCLQEQTFKDFEIICVEDGSTDDSCKFLEHCSQKDERIKLIKRKTKGGTAIKGITYGLEYCKGDYFFYTSQDDLFDLDYFEKMYNKAITTNADIIIGDMIWYKDNDENKDGIYPPNNNYEQILDSKKAFLLSLDWKIHGYYLQKMDFAKKIGWDDIYYNSCEYATRTHLYNASKIVFCNTKAYYRQDNPTAITKTSIKPFKLETLLTDLRLIEFMIQNEITKEPEFKMLYKRILQHYKEYNSFKIYNNFSKDEKKEANKILNKAKSRYIKLAFLSRNIDFISKALKLLKIRKNHIKLKYYLRYKRIQKLSNRAYFSKNKKKAEKLYKIYQSLVYKGIIAPRQEIDFNKITSSVNQLNCTVGRCTYCSPNVVVGMKETTIGSFCSLAGNITIGPGEHPLNYMSSSPFFYLDLLGWNNTDREVRINPCHIGNDVWIGSDVFIKSGITIGDGAVIAAGAVVVKDVEPYAVVGGVPAKPIKYRFDKEMIKDFLELKWWDLDDETIKTLPFKDPKLCIEKLKKIRSAKRERESSSV